MGFQGMRGKKDSLMPDFEDSYFLGDEYEKRAPIGFQSTRGKKTLQEDEYYKRAPMGFQGMRGKKSLEEVNRLPIKFIRNGNGKNVNNFAGIILYGVIGKDRSLRQTKINENGQIQYRWSERLSTL